MYLPVKHAATSTHLCLQKQSCLCATLCQNSLCIVQLEIRAGMALTFQNTDGSLASGTLTSSGTYLTTATFTGTGNFDTVAVPTVSSTSGCGSYANPSIQLAVLVLSLDASVSTSCL